MGSYLEKLIYIILVLGNINLANAQVDSFAIDSNKVAGVKPQLIKKIIIPTAFLGYGALSLGSNSLRQLDRYINRSTIGQHGYSGSADDYLRYGPIAAVYGLDLVGVKAKNNFIDRSAMVLMSMALTSTTVTFTKNNIYRLRPDGSGVSSFPSSHTAMAFMAAEFMHQEYGEKSIWFSVIGYGTATFTGVLRMYHHVHWFSDVIIGAGYGILATKLSYFIYPYLKQMFVTKKKTNLVFTPSFENGRSAFTLNYKF
jgi:hypothetical protein